MAVEVGAALGRPLVQPVASAAGAGQRGFLKCYMHVINMQCQDPGPSYKVCVLPNVSLPTSLDSFCMQHHLMSLRVGDIDVSKRRHGGSFQATC